MKATELKAKYPDVWLKIEKAVLNDIKMIESTPEVTAYNAAFEACYHFDQYIQSMQVRVNERKADEISTEAEEAINTVKK